MPTKSTLAIKATFRGQNGTLGYTTDHRYTLTVEQLASNALLVSRTSDGSGAKRYTSLADLLTQWKDLASV